MVTGVGALIAALLPGDESTPPPLTTQWEHERAQIAREGWEVTVDENVEMHGDSQPSTMVALHRPTGECSSNQPSDQVRIYDVDNGRLDRAFTYQPTATGCRGWTFHVATANDFTGSGRAAVFGEFNGGPFGEPGESVPVAISWDSQSRRFGVTPLITEPPATLLDATHAEGQGEAFQRRAQHMFLTAVRLTSDTAPAYGVSEFRLVPHGAEGTFLYGIYRLTSGVLAANASGPSVLTQAVYQRAIWHLEAQEESFAAGWCGLARHQEVALVKADEDPSSVLDELVRDGAGWAQSCDAPLTSKWWEAHHRNEGS